MRFQLKKDGITGAVLHRVPWLLLLLFLGLIVSGAVGAFEDVIAELPVLVAFQSLILGMAGNAATQSLALSVRGLAQEKTSEKGRAAKRICREVAITLFCGIVLGAVSFLLVCGSLFMLDDYTLRLSLRVGGCVGSAMCLSVALSGLAGAGIPLALCRMRVDPAVASGPLITTAVDLASVVFYYGLAAAFLKGI